MAAGVVSNEFYGYVEWGEGYSATGNCNQFAIIEGRTKRAAIMMLRRNNFPPCNDRNHAPIENSGSGIGCRPLLLHGTTDRAPRIRVRALRFLYRNSGGLARSF